MTSETKRRTAPVFGLKALDGGEGEVASRFEAIVSVFGNVDHQGDRIVPGAFEASLEAWKTAGDPIPVIFSHQWDNLPAHIGVVEEAKELLPGDPALPLELKDLGGLWVRMALDVEDPMTYAPTVARLLSRRSLREFSFAYGVDDYAAADDGTIELRALDVFEVGPTLKGANPLTRLLSVPGPAGRKSVGTRLAEVLDALDYLEGEKAVRHAFTASEDDSSRCVVCGLTRNVLGHQLLSGDPDGAKAWVELTGSAEELQSAAYAAAVAWAAEGDVGNGGFYALYLEATYPDRVVVLVEGWADPVGEGVFYELAVELTEDGAVVSDPKEVRISGEVSAVPKTDRDRAEKRARALAAGKTEALEPGDDEDLEDEGSAGDEPEEGTVAGQDADESDPGGDEDDPEDPETGNGDGSDGDEEDLEDGPKALERALLELDLLDLDA